MNQKIVLNIVLISLVVILAGIVGYAIYQALTPTLVIAPAEQSQQSDSQGEDSTKAPQSNGDTNTEDKKASVPVTQTTLPSSCADDPEGVGKPVITSLSPNSGTLGTKIQIEGCNFSGFEGDKNAWIENNDGVKGILYGENGSTSKLLILTLKSPLCQKDTSYSGMDCDAMLTLVPGTYNIYTLPWGNISNKASFIIE